jgi:hypothetical protein
VELTTPNVLFRVQYYDTRCDGLTFLSDITRPAFLIDLRAVQRATYWTKLKDLGTTSYIDEYSVPIPPILLSQSSDVLVPRPLNDHSTSSVAECPHTFEQTAVPVDILRMESDSSVGDLCFGYIHCRVVKPLPSQLNDGTFLCQLNLNSTVFTEGNNITVDSSDSLTVAPAHLVLGLNNHHVISYYWARSAGSGAAMEAPGVILVYDTKTSSPVQIRWASPEGYTACNSNDGKRSEWVQFLKEGDQIQLRPSNVEAILRSATLRDSIYGITMSGRPLGSEPIVVCQWSISTSS